jgi:glycosyltransferase involved in cell wall biosynthesis
VTGTDLLPAFATVAPLDVFGMKVTGLAGSRIAVYDNPPQAVMHRQLARRRAYVHPMRWTSLGLSLVEAMHLGMPVVVLGTTEAFDAVPPEAGVVSTKVARLTAAARRLLADPGAAQLAGKAARAAALERYGLSRFLADWDRLLREVTR